MNLNDIYMQMKYDEEYIVWNPENITFSGAIYTEVIDQTEDEPLKFIIHSDDMKLELIFSGMVLSFMYSQDGARMLSWSTAQEKYSGDYFGKSPVPVYKIENSVFIKWIMTEACHLYYEDWLTHYCIVTEDDVVDIISMCEPTYRIINTEI